MKFGITETFPCNYIAQQQQRLLVCVDSNDIGSADHYDALLQAGFRRSGTQVYRPHCANCNACQSLRIPVNDFQPSKSQKRISSKNKHLTSFLCDSAKPEHFSLYAKYIAQRHSDGSMFPPSREQYQEFIDNTWQQPLFLEIYQHKALVAVAVTDETTTSLSALYTYFDQNASGSSLGSYAILEQIRWAQTMGKQYLYLGYQIDNCNKMNYKQKFLPNEQYINRQWISFQKIRD